MLHSSLGLRDYTAFLALHTVIDFWEGAGANTLRKYMCDLAKQAGRSMLFNVIDFNLTAHYFCTGSVFWALMK